MQFTIDEYSRRFQMSKEMIRAKIRAGRLRSTVIDGKIFIVVDRLQTPVRVKTPHESTAAALLLMLKKENTELKAKIEQLEAKIDRLIDDKEQMLRQERQRVESLYANRDEQLKSFLELVNTKLIQAGTRQAVPRTETTVSNPTTMPPPERKAHMPTPSKIELTLYLDQNLYTASEKKSIKKRFATAYGHDIRVMQKNGQFILNLAKHDYSDLLAR